MSRNRADRSAKVRTVIAGSEEEREQKDRIDKLQKEKQDLLDGECHAASARKDVAQRVRRSLPARRATRRNAFAFFVLCC